MKYILPIFLILLGCLIFSIAYAECPTPNQFKRPGWYIKTNNFEGMCSKYEIWDNPNKGASNHDTPLPNRTDGYWINITLKRTGEKVWIFSTGDISIQGY